MARHEFNISNKAQVFKMIKTKRFLNERTLLYINLGLSLITIILLTYHISKG